MKRIKRLIALLMTLAMVLAYMPAAVFAETGDESSDIPTALSYNGIFIWYGDGEDDYDGFLEDGNEITLTYSDRTETFVIKSWSGTDSYDGAEYTAYGYFRQGEDVKLDDEGDAENEVRFETSYDSASRTVTVSYVYGYDEEGEELTVSNIYKAKEYAYPVKIEYEGPELLYQIDDPDKYVDLWQDNAKFIITYSDESVVTYVNKKYTYKYEGKKETDIAYFPEGEEPEIEVDEDGNEYAANALYFDVEYGEDSVKVIYEEDYYENTNKVETIIPISVDEDSKYEIFIDAAKNWYYHEWFVDDDEYSFPVPCKTIADEFNIDFTKEDMDKVSITVTTADGKTYNPTVTKNMDSPGDYVYTYKAPKQKWGAKFTINYSYDNGRITDELKCVAKKWVKLKVIVKDLIYNGKNRTPNVTVKYGKTTLVNGKDYVVSSDDPDLRFKNAGEYGIYIDAPEDSKYALYDTQKFRINPVGTTISKLTKGKKSFTVTWKKQTTQTTGYQIQYSLKKNFKGAKIVTVKKNKTTKTKIKKLKAKKTYYVRIRTFKKAGGKTVYSSWSKAKKIKTK